MAFRFRLDAVLRHRARIVDDRSRDVAVAEERYQQANDQLREIEGDLAQAYAHENYPDGESLHLGDLMAQRRWLKHLGNRRAEMVQLRELARTTRDQARGRLEEAWRQREVLESLRKRREQDYRNHESRVETLAMDEIASVRHAARGLEKSSGMPASFSRVHAGGN